MAPLSFTIVGAGAVGALLAARLLQAGAPVQLVEARSPRPRRVEVVLHEGHRVTLQTLPIAAIKPPGLLFLTVKLPGLQPTLDALRHGAWWAPDEVLTLQNGLHAPARVQHAWPTACVWAGAAVVNAVRHGDVVRQCTEAQRLTVAPWGAACEGVPRWLGVVQQAGFCTDVQADANAMLWRKLVGLVPLATVCALSGRPLGMVRADDAWRGLLCTLLEETAAVARAESLAWTTEQGQRRRAEVLQGPADVFPSMAADVCEGRTGELPWLTAQVVELAQQRGVAVPALEAALHQLLSRVEGPARVSL